MQTKTFIRFFLLGVMTLFTFGAWAQTTPDKDYLCFTAEVAGATVQLEKYDSPNAVTIEYSTDEGANWTTVDYSSVTTTGEILLANVGDKVYFRNAKEAKDVTAFSDGDDGYYSFIIPKNVSVSGNLMSLIDKNVESTTIPCDGCFIGLFHSTSLTSAADLKLPATTLKAYCYFQMFNGCSALETAPELPATTLAAYCYSAMFYGCSALETAPELPATILTTYCYQQMFSGCAKLKSVKVGFKAWADNVNATYNWLKNAGTEATTPTFVCPDGLAMNKRDDSYVPARWTVTHYLCITAEEAGAKVQLRKNGTPTAVTIEYSTDEGANWTTVDYSSVTTTEKIVLTNVGDKVYFRNAKEAREVTKFSVSHTMFYNFIFTGNVSVSGNIMSLVDKNVESTTIPNDYCFGKLFDNCSYLTSAADLKLPAMTLKNSCYIYMFRNCKNLKDVPAELPATTLKTTCYASMFENCENITKAPKLPAATLQSSCYSSMFSGCKKLNYVEVGFTAWNSTNATASWLYNVAAEGTFVCPAELDMTTRDEKHVPAGWTVTHPAKPDYLCFTAEEAGAKVQLSKNGRSAAVNLEYTTDGSTWNDFEIGTNSGCGVTLTNVGDKVYLRNKLEAKDVTTFSEGDDGYYSFDMPKNVSVSGNLMSLIDKNAESTTIPCDGCFYRLFEECSGLTSVADLKLPATTLKAYCYQNMFIDCENLTTAPATLPAATLATECYYNMFDGCSALKTAPALPATTLAEKCYSDMFYACSALETAPALPATTLAASCYQSMFSFCSSLKTAPALPAETLAEKCYYEMFYYCENLTTAPATLPAATLATECYYNMFRECKSLETAPALPATTLAEKCYSGMFYNCSALKTAPVLSATALAKHCYSSMFSGCESLETAPELPVTTLAEYCYTSMFYGCKSLETAPALPAETLVQSCYFQMFYDCKKLNFVKVGFKAWADNENATSNWLKNAGTETTTPTFECPAELDLDVETQLDVNHVPAGWKVTYDITANQDPDHKQNYYSTFFTNRKDYQLPDGVTAYTGVVDENTKVLNLTPIEDNIIPAGEGVILRLTQEDNTERTAHFILEESSESGTWSGTNALTGTDVAKTLGANQYALSLGQNGVGFYNWNGRALGAHKAYLTLLGQSAPLRSFGFRFDDGTTTGIPATIFDQPQDDAIYNLQGQRVDESYKGLIIKNGQKVYNY